MPSCINGSATGLLAVTSRATVTVLVVDDDPQLTAYLREMLADEGDRTMSFTAVDVTTIEAATERLADDVDPIDVVLLDLSLPDGWGLDSLMRVRRASATVPIVVITGTQDRAFGETAISAGAQDFLVKDALEPGQLGWALRYAIARQRQLLAERETTLIDQSGTAALFGGGNLPASSKAFAQLPLREAVPASFDQAVTRYLGVLQLALEQRGYRGDYHLSQHVRDVARELGRLRATPRDVIDVHITAVEEEGRRNLPSRQSALIEEGRVMVLELMGHLASYYRQHAMGMPPQPEEPSDPTSED